MISYDIIAAGGRVKVRPPIVQSAFIFENGSFYLAINKNGPNTMSENTRRSCISFPDSIINVGQEFDITFDVLFNEFVKTKDICLLFQLYSAPTEDPWSPPLAIQVENGEFNIVTRTGKTYKEGWESTNKIFIANNFDFSNWNTIRVKGCIGNRLSIWLNDKLVFSSLSNPWGYNYKLTPVFGLYQWHTDVNWDDSVMTKSIQMRNLSIMIR